MITTINEFKDYMLTRNKILNENSSNTYTMYTGVSLKQWNNIWKDKNLANKETNVTNDKSFASDYSYDFETGKYDNIIVEISNIPLDAFDAYRIGNDNEYYDEDDEDYETYSDDDDFHSMRNMNDNEKINIINNYSLFIVSLYDYKEIITTKLLHV